jgi:hypothetical protein
MKIFKQLLHMVIIIAVAMTSLYILANNLPILVGSFRFLWGPFVLASIFILQPTVFYKTPVKFLLLYGAISLVLLQYTLWNHMGDWVRGGLLEEYYSLIIFSSIFFYYYIRRDFSGLAVVGKLGFCFVVITVVMTNIALSFDPMVVRQSIASMDFTPYQARLFKLTGAGGYGYMQALVCLIPVLVFHIKFDQKMVFSKNVLAIILILILFTMLRAQILANLLAATAITVLSFAGAKHFRRSIIMVVMVLIVLLMIPVGVYADILFSLSSYFDPESPIYYKLRDLAVFIQYPELTGTTGAGGRAERYPLLFEAFIAAPIFGDSSYNSPFGYNVAVGGHLYWMNKLAIWGLPGFLFFIFVLYQLIKRIYGLFDNKFGFYYLLSIGAFIFLGLMKNIAGREPFLMLIVVIPGLYFLPLLEKKRQQAIPPHQTNQILAR